MSALTSAAAFSAAAPSASGDGIGGPRPPAPGCTERRRTARPPALPPHPPPEERRGPGQRPPLAGSRPAPAVGRDDARARAQEWANRGAAHLLRNSSTPASVDRKNQIQA